MWDELNRILGVNRKDGTIGTRGSAWMRRAGTGLMNRTRREGAAAAQSQSERERHEPARMALPKNSAPATDDGLGVSYRWMMPEWASDHCGRIKLRRRPGRVSRIRMGSCRVRRRCGGPGSVTSSSTRYELPTPAQRHRPSGAGRPVLRAASRRMVLRTLRTQVAANALELARNGVPRLAPFYVTGQVGRQNFSLHAEGERVFLTQEGQQRRMKSICSPPRRVPRPTMAAMPPPRLCPGRVAVGRGVRERAAATNRPPGTSPLDDFLPAVGEHRPPDEPGDERLASRRTEVVS